MTEFETDHDGWPDEYRDPRDRPHPDRLRVTVETAEEIREATREAAETVAAGDPTPAVVSFDSVADLRKILTDRRLEVLQLLMAIDGAAESIAAVADELDRDYRTVYSDVSLLAEYGLVFIAEEGRSKRPYLPYERIHLDVELVGRVPGEEPTPV